MNTKDVKILACLRQNGRMPISKLSKKTGLPVSTIFDRLRSRNCIERHVALLDFGSLGFSTKAIVLVRAPKETKDALHKYLSMHFHINNLCRVNNGYDYCFECVFKTINELENFLESLEEKFDIKTRTAFYIINEIRREAFLSDPNTAELVLNE